MPTEPVRVDEPVPLRCGRTGTVLVFRRDLFGNETVSAYCWRCDPDGEQQRRAALVLDMKQRLGA